MRCEYCENFTEEINEWQEVVCRTCQFDHEVMHFIDVTPANDGKQSHLFVTFDSCNHEFERSQILSIEEAKSFLKNLTNCIRIAEEMENRNV